MTCLLVTVESLENRIENKEYLFDHLKSNAFLTLFVGMGLSFLVYVVALESSKTSIIEYALRGFSQIQEPLVYLCLGSTISKLRHGEEFKKHLMVDSKIALVCSRDTDPLFYQASTPAWGYDGRGAAAEQLLASERRLHEGSHKVLLLLDLESFSSPPSPFYSGEICL